MSARVARVWRWRPVRFVTVAGVCTTLQALMMLLLAHLGVSSTRGDAIGFVVSTQANFVLSARFTWSDRDVRRSLGAAIRRWLSFNTVACIALGVNVIVLTVLLHLGARLWLAFCCSVLAGAVTAFTINHFATFRSNGLEA